MAQKFPSPDICKSDHVTSGLWKWLNHEMEKVFSPFYLGIYSNYRKERHLTTSSSWCLCPGLSSSGQVSPFVQMKQRSNCPFQNFKCIRFNSRQGLLHFTRTARPWNENCLTYFSFFFYIWYRINSVVMALFFSWQRLNQGLCLFAIVLWHSVSSSFFSFKLRDDYVLSRN